MAGTFLSFFVLVVLCSVVKSSYKLKQVVVLSRHNIRTPLSKSSKIQQITSLKWPAWSTKTGFLTPKGATLEGYMGEYLSSWMVNEELLPAGCPKDGTVNIYANTRQRTKQSAIAFTNSAFRLCNVTVYFKNITEMDPVFNPVIHNNSEAFKSEVIDEMNNKLKKIDLKHAYLEMEKILEYNNSIACSKYRRCSLISDDNVIVYNVGEEPDVDGPFWIGNAAADALLMSFYEGLPLEGIGWGKITDIEQWVLITKFTSANQNVRFNMSKPAKDFAKPLIKYIARTFLSEPETLFTLLMGHDSNLSTVLAALGFKSFTLPGQFERYPVGGKLVFQKFVDNNGEFYLKVEFVYLSWADIRKGDKLSLNNPPRRVTLELTDCKVDANGFCAWSDFVQILKDFV